MNGNLIYAFPSKENLKNLNICNSFPFHEIKPFLLRNYCNGNKLKNNYNPIVIE